LKYFVTGILALICFEAYSSTSELSYVCAVEEATGFIYKNGSWEASKFDESKNKFIIRPLKEGDRGFNNRNETPFALFESGRSLPDQYCSLHKNYEETIFACRGLGELFFSSKTGRFIKTYTSGYYSEEQGSEISPKIMRGHCSKI